MRKLILIVALLACTSAAHAGVRDRMDNWIRSSDMGHFMLEVVKWTGFPIPEKFR